LRHLVPVGTEIVSEFVGSCKQNKASVCVTKTVNDEAFDNLHKIVNRYFDRAKIFAPTVRQNIYRQMRSRLIDLINYTGTEDVASDMVPIKRMYERFSKNPALRAKLEKIMREKHRKSLLPSETDMKILSEAVTFSGKSKVYFITGDKDYSEFKSEIEKETSVIVIDLMTLRDFTFELFS
jgi:hypothetical protein